MGNAHAVTSGAAAGKTGKSIAGAFENISKKLDQSGSSDVKSSPAGPRTTPAKTAPAKTVAQTQVASAPAAPKPEVVYEDASGIQEGMEAAEVTRRFGPPALSLTTGGEEQLLSYTTKTTAIDVTMRNGKVASLKKLDGSK